mgnify:CR=1 FL=1
MNLGKQFKEGLITNNPVLVQVLGMCSTMAITTSFFNGLGMGVAVLVILTLSNVIIAAIIMVLAIGVNYSGAVTFSVGSIEVSLSGLAVAVMIILIGFELARNSVEKILHPTAVEFSLVTGAVLIFSILVKSGMFWMNENLGKMIHSNTLAATAADSRNDVLSTGAVLIAAVLCRVTGWDVLDGLMGVGVAAFILISGWGLVMDTLSPLLGESPSEDLVDHIEQKVLSYPGVLGMHDLMVHDYGPGHQFASLHVELPAEQDPLEAHDLIDNIERDFFKNDRLLVTIHYDPIVTSDAAVGVLRARLTEKLRQLDPALSLHDLRIVPGRTHTNVLFDLVLPAGYAGDKVELLAQLEQFIKEQDAAYSCIIKVEQSYTAAHK